MVAVITIWNQSVVSASLEAMVDGFSVKCAWSSNETFLLYLLCFIHRWLCALQWQFVRLQPARPWCTYSGGPISADHPTGKMHTYIHYDGNPPVCWRQCGHQRAHHTYCGTALWSGLTGMTFTKHYKKFSTFNLTLWLYTSTEVSVASRVSGSQEESDRPRQQSTVCAYNPRGKEDNSSHHFISMSVMPHHVHWSATAHRCQFCFISCNP